MWPSRKGSLRHQRGFTLIEVLVATAIFASLSVTAYVVLNQIQRSNALSLLKSERLKNIQRAMVIIDNDFRQIALRQFRTHGDEPGDNVLLWGDGLLDSESKAVIFTRLGWQNPQQTFPRGEVTKVGYRVIADTLQRVWWRYPDTPVGQDGVITPLLDDVEKINMTFYQQGEWSEEWNTELALPKAVTFTITLRDYGDIERVYLTAGKVLEKAQDES